MENQRTFLIVALMAISAVLYTKWIEFSSPYQTTNDTTAQLIYNNENSVPSSPQTIINAEAVPSTPSSTVAPSIDALPSAVNQMVESIGSIISITTDIVIAKINTNGGVIESIELRKEPIAIDQKDQGFPLLMKTNLETFIAQDGILVSGQAGPNHAQTLYQSQASDYSLGTADSVQVPLTWISESGVEYTKVFTFKRDSYVVDIDYKVVNKTAANWQGYLYAQFNRTQPVDSGGGFGRLPSYTGGAIYTEEEKYEKVDFKDMSKQNLATQTNSGWVAMLQHYFVGAWIPKNGGPKQFYSAVNNSQANPVYRLGYKTLEPKVIPAGQSDTIGTSVYLGSKEQSRLKKIQRDSNITGLALTVDYGVLTFIADPLFTVLNWIHNVVGNWGWSIILLTLLIKMVFYPLSAASYKSMAGMKKLQPRIKTLKERYKDDRQKFQTEMMALYKKEKINPAGGCLPILIQIPVFIALYWALLESVEIRQAPFALWLQDLSAPDPFYILPVLMGASMWAQQQLNPAPMDDIQKKVMTIMPIALTFLFLTFPQGLVLYWVVNNVLSMAQQWFINKKHAS
ncbi:MAG: YidC/Oxa1 family membrane protein insertase [Arenicella sp.]|jgi:YidC/Oxa1 family membrane protein insertase